MSLTTFTTEDYADFRLNLAIKKVSQEILTSILEIAFSKPATKTYFDYLFKDQNVSSKHFDVSQKEKLKNVSGDAFDITLVFKLFVHGCAQVAPTSDPKWKSPSEFEHWLKKVKDLRNDVIHSALPIPYADLNNWMDVIKNTLLELIKVSAVKFRIDDSKCKEMELKVCRDLEAILTTPLTQTEIDEYLVTEGILEAQVRYQKLSYVNPVDFFVGLEFSTKIDDVFVSLEIKELDGYEQGQKIDLKNLLKPFEENTPLIAIEGLAGSGKTTLIKYVMSRWILGSSSMKGLDQYEFLIFLQCNNAYINCLYDLIASIMPETARRFDRQKLIESLLCRRLLVLVDGVDEAHAGTRAILKELLNKGGQNVKFLCTSRPEKIQWLYRIKGNVRCGTYSIIGIPNERRKEFIKKLHKYYNNILNDDKVIPDGRVINMLENLPMAIKSELRLPIFLALFTYFCTVNPSKVSSLNSVFSLYNELTNALKEKLYTRSMSKSDDSRDDDEIKSEIDECFTILCKESFGSLCQNNSNILWDSFQAIKEKSIRLGLTVKEVLSAFLVVKVVLTPRGVEEIVGYPHKGLQEFLAAKAVIERLKSGESLHEIFDLKEASELSLPIGRMRELDLNTDFMKHQNLLMHLAGLIGIENITDDKIVNDIVALYKKAGIYDFGHWLSLFASMKDHALISEYILMKFKKMTIHEGNMENFLELLKNGCPSEVIINLCVTTKTLHKLKLVLNKLILYQCNLKLLLNHHFVNPQKHTSLNIMNYFTQKQTKCVLTWFAGSLNENGILNLPNTVQVLRLGIGTVAQAKALKMLESCVPNLYIMKLHVERHVGEKDFPELKLMVNDFILYLSGMDNRREDIEWADKIALKINSTKKYRQIIFPSSTLNKYTLIHMFKFFAKSGLSVTNGIKASSSAVGVDEEEISRACYGTLGCKFNLVQESDIWPC